VKDEQSAWRASHELRRGGSEQAFAEASVTVNSHHNCPDFAIDHLNAQHICRMHPAADLVGFLVMAMAAQITNGAIRSSCRFSLNRRLWQ
jgi:hypothetical protein